MVKLTTMTALMNLFILIQEIVDANKKAGT